MATAVQAATISFSSSSSSSNSSSSPASPWSSNNNNHRLQQDIQNNTITTTAPSDWPCPEPDSCNFHRRPSWQVEEQLQLSNSSALLLKEQDVSTNSLATAPSSPHKLHNPFALSLCTLPPRSTTIQTHGSRTPGTVISSPAAGSGSSCQKPVTNSNKLSTKPTFLSPFETSFLLPASTLSAVEAPLSPYCLPGSPFTDMDSLASSSGLPTPSSIASPQCSCYSTSSLEGSSSYRQLAPSKARKDSATSDNASQNATASTSSSSPVAGSHLLSCSPTSKPQMSHHPSYLRDSHQFDATTFMPTHSADANLVQYRRRSVDVGTLVNARGHQRHGRTSQADAPAAAFVPPDQLKALRARKTTSQRSKESLFAQHLTMTLQHSLALCSIVAADSDINVYSGSESARSSISSTISSESGRSPTACGPNDRLESSARLHPAPRRVRLTSLPLITPLRRKELINTLSTWAFDANLLDLDELCECACIIFECFLEMDGLQDAASPDRMRKFLISLRAAYHPRNAYHNFGHAVDVLQACYSFVVKLGVAPPLLRLNEESRECSWRRSPEVDGSGRIGDILRPLDVFALLIAAIGHDVGHPGLTNAYMINARAPAAQVYNDKSVLENFHSVTLIRMLKLHGFGHLLEGEGGHVPDFRQVLLTTVLVTDMGRHFPFIHSLNEVGERFKANNYISSSVAEDRLIICSGLMKCGDISNPSRPHTVASFWSSALLEEWQVQADIETKFNLPVSVMTLKAGERMAQAKSQVGFISLFTQPLFDAMAAAVPDFQEFADYCKAGRLPWEAILSETAENKGASNTSIQSEGGKSALSRVLSAPSSTAASQPEYFTAPHRIPRRPDLTLNPTTPLSPGSASSFSTSPSLASFFSQGGDRLSPASTAATFSSSSWVPSAAIEACQAIAEEACTGNCSSITALCVICARQQSRPDDEGHGPSYQSPTSMNNSKDQWPPEPFRPALTANC